MKVERDTFDQSVFVDRTVIVDGVRVRVLESGSGKPLLLLHGLGHSSSAWLRTMDAFSRERRVIVPDMPGFGKSEIPATEILDPPYHARIVLGLIEALELGRTDAIGHSAGALALLLAALAKPAYLDRLILVNPVGFTPAPRSALGAIATSLLQLVLSMRRGRRTVRALYAKSFVNPAMLDEQTVDEIVARRSDPAARRASEMSFSAYFNFCKHLEPFHERLAGLDLPVLVVWGDHDPLFNARNADAARQVMRGARIERFERCGHHPHIEMPSRFAETALEFLSAT